MPGDAPTSRQAGNDGFREAVAQWRLELRTEVKRSSSLPSAMFDACDPMLETRLAETAESMLNRLHEPTRAAIGDGEKAEQRIESIEPRELRSLPQRIAGHEIELDLGKDLAAEYLGILTDVCCLAQGAAQAGAVHLLQRDFGLAASTDLTELTALLAQRVQRSTGAATGDDATALADVCGRVAAALALHLRPGPERGSH